MSASLASAVTSQLALHPENSASLAALCGPIDQHLREIGGHLGVDISNRGNLFTLRGPQQAVETARRVLQHLYVAVQGSDGVLDAESLHLLLRESEQAEMWADTGESGDIPGAAQDDGQDVPRERPQARESDDDSIQTRKKLIRVRGANQHRYLAAIREHKVCFGIGPAGTGKTYLAVAAAVQALEAGRVERLVLVRPAVEAGEKLGFLPGDLTQKIDPYLRPLHDALCDMMGPSMVLKSMERQLIEVAPLAYMRGRTLNKAFIILDEAQNTTPEQMKMFLTRMGFHSQAVVTGDITQIDLPRGTQSGLIHAVNVLSGIDELQFIHFDPKDIVRHRLVQRIVEAYDRKQAHTP